MMYRSNAVMDWKNQGEPTVIQLVLASDNSMGVKFARKSWPRLDFRMEWGLESINRPTKQQIESENHPKQYEFVLYLVDRIQFRVALSNSRLVFHQNST